MPDSRPGSGPPATRAGGGAVVVDASVALKWVLPEPDAELARRLFEELAAAGAVVYVPELFWLETGNVLWRLTRGPDARLSPAEALELLDVLRVAPLRSEPVAPLAARALEIGLAVDITTYDAAYVALAELQNARLWTADARLVDRLDGTEWSGRAVSLSNRA